MKNCRRCLLPEGRFGVRLGSSGICNLCRHFDRRAQVYTNVEGGQERLRQRMDLLKGKYEYDAVVGLSGGKDSTYVLDKLINEYHLHVLAVTIDNGFLTEFARENVDKIVRQLHVAHEYCTPDWEAMRLHYRATLKKHGWPCLACVSSGNYLAIKFGIERKIPFCVNGRSPYQLLRKFSRWTRDPSIGLLNINKADHSFARMARYYRRTDRMIGLWLFWLYRDKEERRYVHDAIFRSPRISPEFAPELINFFLFEPYDEEKIKCYLEERNIGYRRPDDDAPLGHGDCSIHDGMGYLFERKHGVTMPTLELAVMIRAGYVNQEEGEEILKKSRPNPDRLEGSVHHFCQEVGLKAKDFYGTAREANRGRWNFWGY